MDKSSIKNVWPSGHLLKQSSKSFGLAFTCTSTRAHAFCRSMHTNTTNKSDQAAKISKHSLFDTLQQFCYCDTSSTIGECTSRHKRLRLFNESCADDYHGSSEGNRECADAMLWGLPFFSSCPSSCPSCCSFPCSAASLELVKRSLNLLRMSRCCLLRH